MIYTNEFKIYDDRIEYRPVSGVEIKTALQRGLYTFMMEKKVVDVYINDILITINSNTTVTKLVTEYFTKLERKYRMLQSVVVNSKTKDNSK